MQKAQLMADFSAGTIFIFFFVPETKGKSPEEIKSIFTKESVTTASKMALTKEEEEKDEKI